MRSRLTAVVAAAVMLTALPDGLATSAEADAPPSEGISFTAPVDFATGAVPASGAANVAAGDQLALSLTGTTLSDGVATGDFNGDGRADVVQTNVFDGTVSVFVGDGRGGFAAPQRYAVGVLPVFVATGDLDGDDTLDLVVANYGSNNVAILRGFGDATFKPPTLIPAPAPRNVAIASFDRDGVPDLAIASASVHCPPACPTSTTPIGGVSILAGTGRGGFRFTQFIQPTHTATGQSTGAKTVSTGDFDGNGVDDLAIGVGNTRNAGAKQAATDKLTGDDLLIHLNRGAAGSPFATTPSQPAIRVGGSPEAIAVGDWNGDAHRDLAVVHSGSGDVTSLLGDGAGHFAVKAVNVSVGSVPRSLEVGDFDGDSIADLVTAHYGASTISVLRGRGDGTFDAAVDFWAGDAPSAVAVGHFNRDARLDVVASRLRPDALTLLRNNSPRAGDGVVVTRDIAYGSPTHPASDDPFAAHHTLDVYSPPPGTASFAGPGERYPVLFFTHGGGPSGDKSANSYLWRSLAREGVVIVSTNFRLGQPDNGAMQDVVQAFRWTRANVGANQFGGDAANIFVSGHSSGCAFGDELGSSSTFASEREHVRGLVMVSHGAGTGSGLLPPTLFIGGTESLEVVNTSGAAVYSAGSKAQGSDTEQVVVPGRDHMTILSQMARPGDPGRAAMLRFMKHRLNG